jgi:hypothetical protein
MRSIECGEIRTSALGFGCGGVMGRVGRRDSLRAMNAAWDTGIRLFDTARSYGYGEAEGLLGAFLQGKREHATVVTKFGILPSRTATWKRLAKPLVRSALSILPQARGAVRRRVAGEMSAGHFDIPTLRTSLEESLRQLRTHYVDVLLMHEPPASVMAQDDLLAELAKIVSEGKARRAGLSTIPPVAAMAIEHAPTPLGAIQFPGNILGVGLDSPLQDSTNRFFIMLNHPFGGAEQAARLAMQIAAMANDPKLVPTLREKLQGDPRQKGAEIVFSELFRTTGAHVVVPSMLHLGNLRANVAAIGSEPLSPQDCKAVLQNLYISVREA